jgi:hypothetical protein
LRLAKESIAQEESIDLQNIDVESMLSDQDDDKTYAAMGVAKTIGTVSFILFSAVLC